MRTVDCCVQDVAGETSATGRVQHLECCVHRAAEAAFTSCLRCAECDVSRVANYVVHLLHSTQPSKRNFDRWHQRLCPCRAQQPSGSYSGKRPLPLLQLSRTTKTQGSAVSHACLQLRRLELLIEPATVSCVTRLMAHMPTHADVAPPTEGK